MVDPTEINEYLDESDFPATGGELAGVAAGNGAPEEAVEKLRELEGTHVEDPADLQQKLS